MAPKIKNQLGILVVLTFLVLLPKLIEGLKCYQSAGIPVVNGTQSPALPENATMENCSPDETMCIKAHMKVVDRVKGVETFYTTYQWSCNAFGPYSLLGLKCGDSIQEGEGAKVEGQQEEFSSYTRKCTCCEDHCNNSTMDAICNEEPVFTHMCYAGTSELSRGADPIDPTLPKNVLTIPCTASQVCMKMATKFGADSMMYMWGCINLADDAHCGSWSNYSNVDGTINKMCTCCGELCNGHAMDSVTGDNADCGFPETTSGATSGGTTKSPTTSSPADDSAVIIGATLGVLLFVAVVALGVAIAAIERNRSDRVGIVSHEAVPSQN